MSPSAQADRELDELIDATLAATVDDAEELTAIDSGVQARAAILAVVVIVRAFHMAEELDQSVQ